MPSFTVAQLAGLCGGVVEGNAEHVIAGANSLESAGAADLSFVANQKAELKAAESRAGCLLVSRLFAIPGEWSLIRVDDARRAFARALMQLYPAKSPSGSIHPSAVIATTATIAPGCTIGPHVTVGENAQVGVGAVIGPNCSLGDRVIVGDYTVMHPNVTVYDGVRIGSRVLLHAGCVIGADGFGFTLAGDHYEKFPQVGTVEIGDDVEIGANTCIDRAALGVTSIGQGAKVDNLVHIAHNCAIGCHVVIAAQAGLSGGVVIGDYAFIGGQTGIGDKAKIDAKAVVAAGSGILTSQRIQAGEPVWGLPARPLRQHLKNLAHVGKLTEIREDLRRLKREVTALRAGLRDEPDIADASKR